MLILTKRSGFGAIAGARRRAGVALTKHAENTSAISDVRPIGSTADNYYNGQLQYNPGANVTIKRITISLDKTSGSISGKSYTCTIHTDDGTNINALIATSASVTGSDSWSDTDVDFDFVGATLNNGTNYVIVVSTGAAADASNFASVNYTAAGGLTGLQGNYNSAGTRKSFGTIDMKCILWK